jgi:uncharacterized protein YhfF
MGNARIEACWRAYLGSLPAEAPQPARYFEAEAFGGEGEHALADELADLIARGDKTATSTLLRHYEESGEPLEQAGDLIVVLDSKGQPRCVIEMTEIETRPFRDVDAGFARDYGEGGISLPWWREHLGAYYARQSAAKGWPFDENTPLVCKRFRLVHHCAPNHARFEQHPNLS